MKKTPFWDPERIQWSALILLLLGIFLIQVFVSGCASVPQELNPKIYYKHDMDLAVNGTKSYGVYVAPRAEKYLIRIESRADVDMLTITTCQRDWSVESAIKQGWFQSRRGYEFMYIPSPIEREPGCPLKLAGYERVNGRHSWAFIDFESPQFELPAGITCNGGEEYRADGVSVCQSLTGLIQQIRFSKPVKIAESAIAEKCKLSKPANGTHWRFEMPNRECIYIFEEIESGKLHRLTTIGYEETPIRGG